MGTRCTQTRCQETRCNVIVPHSMFEKLLEDEPDYAYASKYGDWHRKQYTETNKLLKWCPKPECSHLIKLSTGYSEEHADCGGCGTSFCLKCDNEPHEPATCDMYARWLGKTKGMDLDQMWLALNTKPCPECKTPIEKNDGCMHMTCGKCGAQFCWMCLKLTRVHAMTCDDFATALGSNSSLQ